MAEKRFYSKVDLWLLVVLVLVLVIQAYALFSVLIGNAPWSAKSIMIATTVLVFLLVGSMLARTHYTISDGLLTIVCGPIFRKIKIAEITSIKETRNPLSSPALSLDRLRIRYGKSRSVMISPADKRDFLKALGMGLDP